MRRAKATTLSSRSEMRPATHAASGMSKHQRDQPCPQRFAAQHMQRRSRRLFHHAMEDDLHHQRMEDEQEHEQAEKLGKEFMRSMIHSPLGSSNR